MQWLQAKSQIKGSNWRSNRFSWRASCSGFFPPEGTVGQTQKIDCSLMSAVVLLHWQTLISISVGVDIQLVLVQSLCGQPGEWSLFPLFSHFSFMSHPLHVLSLIYTSFLYYHITLTLLLLYACAHIFLSFFPLKKEKDFLHYFLSLPQYNLPLRIYMFYWPNSPGLIKNAIQ